MRVYRDTRFSKNKTPYKTNIGIQFRHELGKDAQIVNQITLYKALGGGWQPQN